MSRNIRPDFLSQQHLDTLVNGCDQLGLVLSEKQLQQLSHYVELLASWNRAFNLTAIREPGSMVVKHLLDSLAVFPHLSGNHLLDVGTGPGLPGIPLAICDPGRYWTLVDSNGKKTRFLNQVRSSLALQNLEIIKSRIEALDKTSQYDAIISRAFASLSDFVEFCSPLLSAEGQLVAMKGQVPAAEISTLTGQQWQVKSVAITVPFLNEARHLVVVKSKKTTV